MTWWLMVGYLARTVRSGRTRGAWTLSDVAAPPVLFDEQRLDCLIGFVIKLSRGWAVSCDLIIVMRIVMSHLGDTSSGDHQPHLMPWAPEEKPACVNLEMWRCC